MKTKAQVNTEVAILSFAQLLSHADEDSPQIYDDTDPKSNHLSLTFLELGEPISYKEAIDRMRYAVIDAAVDNRVICLYSCGDNATVSLEKINQGDIESIEEFGEQQYINNWDNKDLIFYISHD